MEPLQQIIKEAEEANILSNRFARQRRFRCSLYAYDVVLFAKPSEGELTILKRILQFFAQISGLDTNMNKIEIYPISCSELDLDGILSFFPGNKKSFPCKYLGLPLHTRKLRKVDLQPVVDKIGSRIPGWKGSPCQVDCHQLQSIILQHCPKINVFINGLIALDGLSFGKEMIQTMSVLETAF